ncbi:hypothetical protein EDD15DRAFT_758374 [Pisolithus albus]|nr:hypothetical protein EDD15DRAFT_758374 [Pisolithus albus]
MMTTTPSRLATSTTTRVRTPQLWCFVCWTPVTDVALLFGPGGSTLRTTTHPQDIFSSNAGFTILQPTFGVSPRFMGNSARLTAGKEEGPVRGWVNRAALVGFSRRIDWRDRKERRVQLCAEGAGPPNMVVYCDHNLMHVGGHLSAYILRCMSSGSRGGSGGGMKHGRLQGNGLWNSQ